ncbi:MAG: hypothetical protein WAU88_00715, partial [Candidatus Zixiibacteriota bacterium]
MRTLVFVAMLFAVAALASHATAEVDTLKFGIEGHAHLYNGGIVKIPIYVRNQGNFSAFVGEWAINSDGPALYPDSVSFGYRTPPGIGDDRISGVGLVDYEYVLPSETLSVLWITKMQSRKYVLPGAGPVGALWFSGGVLGEHINLAVIDSGGDPQQPTYFPQYAYYDSTNWTQLVPCYFAPSNLTVVPAPIEVIGPDAATGQTGFPITFDVSLAGNGSLFTLELVSLVGPSGPISGPVISGTNPFVITWTPAMSQFGTFDMVLRGHDAFGQTVETTIAVTVAKSTVQG